MINKVVISKNKESTLYSLNELLVLNESHFCDG